MERICSINNSTKNGGGIRLTISKYYLPSENQFLKLQFHLIFLLNNQFEFDTDKDNQLNYAIELFNHNKCHKLPMRQGVGIIVLNENNQVFVAKEKIIQ